jgi:hypothetical protein
VCSAQRPVGPGKMLYQPSQDGAEYQMGLVFVYKQVLLESFKPSLLSNHHFCHLCEFNRSSPH